MILDKHGNEMKESNIKKTINYIKSHPSIFIAVIPLTVAVMGTIIQFLFFLYQKGWALYFSIPDEYILIGNSLSIYSIFISGLISLAYVCIIILTTRMWLQKDYLKSIGFILLIPMLMWLIVIFICIEDPMLIFNLSKTDWIYLLYLLIGLLIAHILSVILVGYCIAYPLHEDIVKKKRNIDRKKNKKVKKKKYTRLDNLILGLTIIAVTFTFFLGLAIFIGYNNASNTTSLRVTYIDELLYVCVMNDGENLILKRGEYKNKILIIYSDEIMRVDSNGYLLKDIQYEKVEKIKYVDQIQVTSNNDIFTDTFFNGLKEIQFHHYDKIYDDKPLTLMDDMQKVSNILANLTLVENNESNKDNYVGNLALVFTYDDGSEKTIIFTSDMLIYEDNAFAVDKDICKEIENIFYK